MKLYQKRRIALMQSLEPSSIVVLFSAPLQYRSSDTERPFRQNSDFYYLSGFKEYQAVLVLMKDSEGKIESILFSLVKDKQAEIWTGPRVGQEAAKEVYLFDEAHPIDQMETVLPALLKDKMFIYHPLGQEHTHDQQLFKLLNKSKELGREANTIQRTFRDIRPVIHEMRLFKDAEEIELHRKATSVSAEAHRHLMQVCRPGMRESDLQAEFIHHCMRGGCVEMAYPPIVGGGNNACILHYTKNDQMLRDGDLVLIDAGSEYGHYVADITRTFPINGRFSDAQRAVYQVVLKAQLAALAAVKPGAEWNFLQETILKEMVEGLIELSLLKGNPETLIAEKAYRRFYMHNSGHWLGLDVHDVGAYKQNGVWRTLQPNMMLTIEPGIYISPDDTSVSKEWRGIGVRIEDDVLVTRNGHEILTVGAPKTIDEIETLMHA